jgi:C1A family cysteine protease
MASFKGCLKSPIDVRDYKLASSGKADLPEEYEVSTLPRVKNQRSVNSCVAHSTSSILEYYEKIMGRTQDLSTNFIYGIQKSECGHDGQGMYLRDACKIVCKYGDMLEDNCPGNNEVPKCWDIAEIALDNEEYKEAAQAFKIKSYFSCTSNNAIKKAIMNYGPVLASIDWYDSYKPNKSGILATAKSGDHGYHAIMIYGWDKTGFKCQNSWGSSWGKKGRFVAPYEIKIAEARCFVDEIDTEVIVPKRNALLDFFYSIINTILNLFKK